LTWNRSKQLQPQAELVHFSIPGALLLAKVPVPKGWQYNLPMDSWRRLQGGGRTARTKQTPDSRAKRRRETSTNQPLFFGTADAKKHI